VKVLFSRVTPTHGGKYAIRAALKWNVEAFTGRRRLRDRIHYAQRHVAGVRGDEPEPLQPRNGANDPNQIGKLALGDHVATVGINVLTQQSDFLVALGYEISHFLDDAFHRTRLLHSYIIAMVRYFERVQ